MLSLTTERILTWLLQSRGSERVGLASRLCPGAEHCLVPVRWDEGSRPLSPSAGLDGAGTRAVACFVYLTEVGQMWQTWLFPAWPLFLTKFWQKEQGICGLSFVPESISGLQAPQECKSWLCLSVVSDSLQPRGL